MHTPDTFNWTTAGLVFITYILIDVLYAWYIIAVGKRQEVQAAAASSLLYSLAAYGVLTYSRNSVYIAFLAAGAFLGTYIIVKLKK
jgi:hypothetical protein